MRTDRPLGAPALVEIGKSLHGKLRARSLDEAVIARCEEDALQSGVLEYLRVRAVGTKVRNRDAFIVDAAFKRAIDELRRESRRCPNPGTETLAKVPDRSQSVEEQATEHVLLAQVRRAIATLPAEESRVLTLRYLEARSVAECAAILFMSESSVRRALHRAEASLASRLTHRRGASADR